MQIPHDIWLYIASFLPNSVLHGLLGLNSVFFHIAMNARYKKVTLCNLGSTETTRKLLRLK